jgi:hypothetical protein
VIWILYRSTVGLRVIYHRRRGSSFGWRTTSRARVRHLYTMFFILIKNLALRANYSVAGRHMVLIRDCRADSRSSYYKSYYHALHQLLPKVLVDSQLAP